MQCVGRQGLHPAGEAFIEPEIVPPGHGDEVAEPLTTFHGATKNTGTRTFGMHIPFARHWHATGNISGLRQKTLMQGKSAVKV
jgi:hypothetical protein